MSQYIQFGSGWLYLNPIAGDRSTNPTSCRPLTVQDITIDIQGDIKELKGQYQFPDDTAVGDKKGMFKFGMGRKDFLLLNQIYFADTIASGGTSVSPNEIHVAAASIGVTPPNGGTIVTDLGVSYQATGNELIKVSSGGSVSVGHYKASGSTYSFTSAETGNLLISYSYTQSSAGQTYQVNQQLQGYGPQFEVFLVDAYQLANGCYNVVHLFAAKIGKVNMVNKRSDYDMPELDGQFFANASGQVIEYFCNTV